MNDLEALKSFKEYGEKRKQEQERISKEILKQSVSELNENLINSFNQKTSFIEKQLTELTSDYEKRISEALNKIEQTNYNNEPMRFKFSSLAMSFLVGMLTMTILSGIVWYQWIRPYQVSKNQTIKNNQGTLFIGIPKRNIIEQGDYYYYPIN